jgi:cell division transport system permease protein
MASIEKLLYFLKQGLRGMAYGPVLTLITILTVAISLVLVGFLVFMLSQADRLLEQVTGGLQMTVYLEKGVTVQEGEELARVISEEWPEVSSARVYTATQDYTRNKAMLPPEILEGLDDDLIPSQPYVEVLTDLHRLKRDKLEAMVAWFKSLDKVEGVDEILLGSEKLRVAFTLLESFRYVASFISLVVLIAALFFVLATIRLSAQARREEVEVMLLIGATKAHVRIPFFIEGMFQGLAGGGLAYFVVWLLQYRITVELRSERFLQVDLNLLPPGMVVGFLGGGLALGLLGAIFGVGRYIRQTR